MRSWIAHNRGVVFLACLLVFGAILGQSVAERNDEDETTLVSTDASSRGALALALWLERLGYRVQRLEQSSLPLEGVDLLFLLSPSRPIERREADALYTWIEQGGVLVYVPWPGSISLRQVGVPQQDPMSLKFLVDRRLVPLTETSGVLDRFFRAPIVSGFNVQTRWALDIYSAVMPQWVPVVFEEDRVFAATSAIGRGRIYAVSSESLLTNGSIARGENAAFMLNVLAQSPRVQSVAFEEAHHKPIAEPDLFGVMRTSPWGWAVWYAAVMTFVFMLWGGRRFGPAVVPVSVPSRSTGEYISSFAGLLQRARATDWLQKRYAALVRRRVATQLGVRADLSAGELARLMSERRPIDHGELGAAVIALDGPPIGERRLLQLVRSIEEMLRRGGR